ncbi:MAG: ROK family protein [Pseudomonadota bacterium]
MTDEMIKSQNLQLRDAEEYNPIRARKKPEQAAGIYITEDRIDCVVGTLYEEKNEDKIVHIAPLQPKTKNAVLEKRMHTEIPRDDLSIKELIQKTVDWLSSVQENLQGVVIACFGPFESLDGRGDTHNENNNYGKLSYLPNYPLWSEKHIHFLFCSAFERSLGRCPNVRVFSDVDVAAYGEYWYRYSQLWREEKAPFYRSKSIAFVKVSRSVGVGFAHRGALWRGRMHTVAGAIPVKRYARIHDGVEHVDRLPGICPFHGGSLEGLIGQNAIEARTKLDYASANEADDWLWDMVAFYIAMLCVTVCSLAAPSQIVIGGRIVRENLNVKHAKEILQRVRSHFYAYVDSNDPRLLGKTVNPDYPELRDASNFISLPSRPTLKNGNERLAMPGRHGALRLAAAKIYEERRNTDARR